MLPRWIKPKPKPLRPWTVFALDTEENRPAAWKCVGGVYAREPRDAAKIARVAFCPPGLDPEWFSYGQTPGMVTLFRRDLPGEAILLHCRPVGG